MPESAQPMAAVKSPVPPRALALASGPAGRETRDVAGAGGPDTVAVERLPAIRHATPTEKPAPVEHRRPGRFAAANPGAEAA
jgi:hypothetical protein